MVICLLNVNSPRSRAFRALDRCMFCVAEVGDWADELMRPGIPSALLFFRSNCRVTRGLEANESTYSGIPISGLSRVLQS